MDASAPQTHRFHLITHPDGRRTVAIYSPAELARMFSAEAIAFLMFGKFVVRDGKRHVDLVAYHLHHAKDDPAPGLMDHVMAHVAAVRIQRAQRGKAVA